MKSKIAFRYILTRLVLINNSLKKQQLVANIRGDLLRALAHPSAILAPMHHRQLHVGPVQRPMRRVQRLPH